MTREESIERIKTRFDKWALDNEDMKAIQTLIPELQESEDENIRKEINNLYSEIDTCISELLKARTDKDAEAEGKALFKAEGLMVATLQCLSCIEDYLEKKQKLAELPKSEDYGIDGLYAAVDILQKTLGEVDGYQTDDGILEHECAISAVKELYEQKSGECDIDEEIKNYWKVISGDSSKTEIYFTHFNAIAEHFYTLSKKPAECIPDSVKFEEGFKAGRESGLRYGQKYAINNLDSYGLCESAGWSKEDERILKRLAVRSNNGGPWGKVFQENLAWLKSLRPQQKVELNDEDKTRFMSCLLKLRTNEGVDTKNSRWFETRFASLCTQPHWKPSEEQMKYLAAAIEENNENPILESLYNDLKKL